MPGSILPHGQNSGLRGSHQKCSTGVEGHCAREIPRADEPVIRHELVARIRRPLTKDAAGPATSKRLMQTKSPFRRAPGGPVGRFPAANRKAGPDGAILALSHSEVSLSGRSGWPDRGGGGPPEAEAVIPGALSLSAGRDRRCGYRRRRVSFEIFRGHVTTDRPAIPNHAQQIGGGNRQADPKRVVVVSGAAGQPKEGPDGCGSHCFGAINKKLAKTPMKNDGPARKADGDEQNAFEQSFRPFWRSMVSALDGYDHDKKRDGRPLTQMETLEQEILFLFCFLAQIRHFPDPYGRNPRFPAREAGGAGLE